MKQRQVHRPGRLVHGSFDNAARTRFSRVHDQEDSLERRVKRSTTPLQSRPRVLLQRAEAL